jgi:Cation transporting ATPase, C-terminus
MFASLRVRNYWLGGVAFSLAFTAVIIFLPPAQSIFKTASLSIGQLAILACYPVIVWGSDELWRWRRRSRAGMREPAAAVRWSADRAGQARS